MPAPAGVGLDVRGDIWVSSPAYAPGNSVREFSPAGHQLRSFGTTQAGYGDLGDPGGIAVGPGGRIYVAQPDYGLVSVFSPAGSFYTEFGLQPGTGQADEDLEFPQGLAVTATGQIWVADSGHNRVAQFGPVPGIPATGAPAAPGGPSRPLIIGECLLALVIAGLGWTWPATAATALHPAVSARPAAAHRPACCRGACAASLQRAGPGTASLRDIEHIVILMQENRSFDHYFGTMPGVRGFSDPAAIRLPDGSPVFRQPHPGHAQGYLTPFRLDTSTTSAQATPGTDHSWATQHEAWNNGKMDQGAASTQWGSCGAAVPGDSSSLDCRREMTDALAAVIQAPALDGRSVRSASSRGPVRAARVGASPCRRDDCCVRTGAGRPQTPDYDENDGLFDHVAPAGRAVLRPAGRLPAVAGGHHPGRRRGRAAHRPAGGVRQPGPLVPVTNEPVPRQ